MLPLLAAAILALAAADAPATASAAGGTTPPGATTPPVVKPPLVNDDDKVVCVTESQTGSLFKQRTCATKAEWRKKRERDRENARQALDPQTAASSFHRE